MLRTPLVLEQGSDVSHHPATYVSPASPSCRLHPPVLLMLLHTLSSAFSTVQVPQAPLLPQEYLSTPAFRYRAGHFRPAKARKATDRQSSASAVSSCGAANCSRTAWEGGCVTYSEEKSLEQRGNPKIHQYLPLSISERGRGICRKSELPISNSLLCFIIL